MRLLNGVLENFGQVGIAFASDQLQLSVRQISLVDTIKLYRFARWADCRVITSVIALRWKQAWDRMDLLEAASVENDIEVAKIAIAQTPYFGLSDGDDMDECQPPHFDWWTRIANIRAGWQVELTRLYWSPVEQTIDRVSGDSVPAPVGSGPKWSRRKKETILRRSHRSRKEMADLLNPK